ncbi:MAG: ABC transporter permease [Deltaproteobacteria bacterium]|nr:ABC transporter permease [Deltaproteobacteria bacterium]MCB9788756.1 ABC transporter permease [Deltaproteobacteria bacterium]
MNASTTNFFEAIGAPVVDIARAWGSMFGCGLRTLRAIAMARIAWREVIHQSYLIGNRSVPFITVTLGFLGMISVYQVAMQIKQIIPDFTMLGPAFIQIMIREFAPTITGLMIATRVGSGIAAEIGSMTVTEQVDALRMCNADPIVYLIVPRAIACMVMVLMLSIYAVLVSTISGMLMANGAFDINMRTFLSLQLTNGDDIVIGAVKALAYGFSIPIIAGNAGLTTSGGSEGVGWATTRAVVSTSFAVVVLDFLISAAGYIFT